MQKEGNKWQGTSRLKLESIVAHKPLPKEIQKQFTFEFKELFPKKLLIPIENDLLSFEFTSELII